VHMMKQFEKVCAHDETICEGLPCLLDDGPL